MDASGNWSTSQGFWDQTASAQSAWSWSGQGTFDFTPNSSDVTQYTGIRTTWESGDQNWAEGKQEHWSLAADGTTWLVLVGTGWGSGSSFDATQYVGHGEYGSTSASNAMMHGNWNESGSQRTDRDSQYQYVLTPAGTWSTASGVWNEHGQSQSTWQWAGSGRFEYEPNLSASTQYYGERRITESGRRNWQETTDATWNWSGSAWVVATGVGTGTGSGFDSISFNGDGTYATPNALVTLSGSGGTSGSSVRVESSGTWWENGDQRSRYETAYQFALNASGDWTTPHADKSLWEQSNSAWGWNGSGTMSAVASSVIDIIASGSNVTTPPIFTGSTSWSESGSRSWEDQYESEYERSLTDTTWRAVRGSGTGISDRKTESSFNGQGTYSWTNAGTPVTGTWADSGGAYSSIHIDRTYTLRIDASNSGSASNSTSAFWDTEAISTDLFRNHGGFTYTGPFTYAETDRHEWQDEFVELWAVAYGVDAQWEQVSGIGTGTASGSGRRTTTAAGTFYGSDASGNTITGAWDASAKDQDDFEASTHHTWVPASGSTSSRYVSTGDRTAHDEQ